MRTGDILRAAFAQRTGWQVVPRQPSAKLELSNRIGRRKHLEAVKARYESAADVARPGLGAGLARAEFRADVFNHVIKEVARAAGRVEEEYPRLVRALYLFVGTSWRPRS